MDDSPANPPAEWTEYSSRRGLDPLGMQTSSVRLYQSLVPGISNITLRLRYYGLYPWLARTYAKRIGHTDPTRWVTFVRRAEALYALVACRADAAVGVAGIDWAQRTVDADFERIDFSAAADPNGASRYLKRAAFDAAYRTQLFELGALESSTDHDIPVPSDYGDVLAEAFERTLGEVANLIFDVIQRGSVTAEELDRAANAVPSAIPASGPEADLYRRLLLDSDTSRSLTLTLLLTVTHLLGFEPRANDFRWILYAGCDAAGTPFDLHKALRGHSPATLAAQRDRWWVYHANDLCHVAYETLLKFLLDTLGDYRAGVAPALLVDRCADEVIAAMGAASRTWTSLLDTLIPAHNAYDPDDPTSEFTLARRAIRAGRNHGRLCGPDEGVAAVSLLATLHRRLKEQSHDIEIALGHLDERLFRSLLTEIRFLERLGDKDFRITLRTLLEKRVLGRHLWVALRKLRYQGDYGFLVEADDGLVRPRALDGPVYTTPRIAPAITFLKDCHLIDANGLTAQGAAALGS